MQPFERGFIKQAVLCGFRESQAWGILKVAVDSGLHSTLPSSPPVTPASPSVSPAWLARSQPSVVDKPLDSSYFHPTNYIKGLTSNPSSNNKVVNGFDLSKHLVTDPTDHPFLKQYPNDSVVVGLHGGVSGDLARPGQHFGIDPSTAPARLGFNQQNPMSATADGLINE